jgi:tRNA A-37 threonylcarbamoyl transferase component Bud32
MGEVYEATHTTIGHRFAIKFLRPEVATPDIVERFRNEARAAGGANNEHIAAALDFGIAEDGSPFIVMELLKGENLASLLAREGQLPVSRAVGIIIQACLGLNAAHKQGIVHRDLKPENLFICKRDDGTDLVKVLDFGIAKLRAGGSLTRPGMAMGTPLYMPPEQFANLASVGSPGDVYGLGVILYEALTGKKANPDGSYYEIMHHVTNIDPPPIEALRPGFPLGLSDVVSRAMARKAGDRFQTVEALMEALKPFTTLASPSISTKVLPTADRSLPTRPVAISQPSPAPGGAEGRAEDPRARRGPNKPFFRPGNMIAVVVVVFLALAFAGWATWSSRLRERKASVFSIRTLGKTPGADAQANTPTSTPVFDVGHAPSELPEHASAQPGGPADAGSTRGGRPGGGRPGGRPQAVRRLPATRQAHDAHGLQPQVSGSTPAQEPNVAPRPRSRLRLAPDQVLPENPAKPKIEEVYPGN